MAAINSADIRNIVLAGHGGAGKTILAERLLMTAGVIPRMGTVEDGSTVMDYTDEEKAHHHSLATSVASFEHDGRHINLVDTPGLGDFIGHAICALPAGEIAAMVVDAAKGVETGTRRLMAVAAERDLPRLIVVNKIDAPELDLAGVVEALRNSFGSGVLPINLPTADCSDVINVFEAEGGGETAFSSVEEAHTQIVEQVVEVDEDLMAQYLEEGAEGLDKEAVHAAFERALREGHLIPVCFVSAKSGAGAEDLLRILTRYAPSPPEGNPRKFVRGEEGAELRPEPDPSKPLIAHVFKIAADPYVGRLGVFRVHQGTLRVKDQVHINDEKKALRIGHMFRLKGKEHVEVEELGPGEIGAVAKIEEVVLNGVLHANGNESISLLPLPLPKPMFGQAVQLKSHKDEAKFGPAVAKLQAEDPCFVVERIAATRQTVARGLGELHLRVLLGRLKEQFGIDVETSQPKVAYKETITAKAEGHHRHKKQTGGAGEFGEVYLRVEPLPADHPEGFEFVNAVVGGAVPRQFLPAIEKGVRQVLAEGAVAGYPMSGIKVEVYDGKYHPVDSKEVAFIKAGRRAFIDAVNKASPALLEPFVMLEVTIPPNAMGDITGDLSTKRGRVQDTEMVGSDTCVIKAVAPLGELQNYSNELKSITGGSGSFVMDYSHDERTPPHIQQEVIAAFKPKAEED